MLKNLSLTLSLVFAYVLPLVAGSTQTVNAPCDKAITKAMVIAAHRKWASLRPDPQAPVLNIETHANFGKDVLLPLGAVWSHPKGGELVFDDQGSSCEVSSNGHPADVVLSDLVKTFSDRPANAADKRP